MKTIMITGASSGIGKETAMQFLKKGFKVIATARNLSNMHDLKILGCSVYSLDVTNEQSIRYCFEEIWQDHISIDVLVNNAGFSQNGFIEELSYDQLKYQFDVNVFGLIQVTQMVLPNMRERKKGHIINIGSVGGEFTSPGAGAYHASKYALESISDAMRQELSNFGIHVSLIKPGGVQTAFVDNSKYPDPIPGNPYRKMRQNFEKMLTTILEQSESNFSILQPSEVASAIVKTTMSKEPESRIRVGRTAKLIPFIKKLLSDKAFDKMIIKQLGLLQ